MCGDPWSGWDDAAASAACRQSGYVAGGMAVRTWRQGALPALLLGRIACNGTEAVSLASDRATPACASAVACVLCC